MTPCVCLRRRRGRLIGAVTEQMVPARHWTSDRGKINAHNFKTKKKLINMEEHKIALHQCRILINRCFVCGLLVFFSPLLFSNGDNLCFFRAEGRLWRFQIKLVCFFFLSFSHAPPLPPKHTSTVCSSSSLLVFLLIIFSPWRPPRVRLKRLVESGGFKRLTHFDRDIDIGFVFWRERTASLGSLVCVSHVCMLMIMLNNSL